MKRIVLPGFAFVAFVYSCNLWQTVQPFVSAEPGATPTHAEALRLEATVRTLSEQFPLRHGANVEQLTAAGGYLEAQLADAGVHSRRQDFAVNGQNYFNVLANVGPATGPRIVVGAHYDSHPKTPGADDNASGVAAVVELARLFALSPPSCPVELALWTFEKVPVRFALSVEMVGFFSDGAGTQKYPPGFPFTVAYPSEGNFALLLGDTSTGDDIRKLKAGFLGSSSLPMRSINALKSMPEADFSDHLNFWAAGFDAYMLTDTAFLRNANYHKPTDTPDTLNYGRMAEVANGLVGMIHASCAYRN